MRVELPSIHAKRYNSQQKKVQLGKKKRTILIVNQNLRPTSQSQKTEGLRLDLNRDIEFLFVISQSAHVHSPNCHTPVLFHPFAFKIERGGEMTDLHDSVNPKGNRTGGPEEHHQAGQSIRLLSPPIVPYLRDQLDAPEDGTDGAEDVGGQGDITLRCHCCC